MAEVDDFDMGSRLKSHIANRLQRPRERHVQEAGAAVKSAIFDDIDALRDVDGDEKPAVIGLPPEVTLRRKTTLVTDLFNSFESGQPPATRMIFMKNGDNELETRSDETGVDVETDATYLPASP